MRVLKAILRGSANGPVIFTFQPSRRDELFELRKDAFPFPSSGRRSICSSTSCAHGRVITREELMKMCARRGVSEPALTRRFLTNRSGRRRLSISLIPYGDSGLSLRPDVETAPRRARGHDPRRHPIASRRGETPRRSWGAAPLSSTSRRRSATRGRRVAWCSSGEKRRQTRLLEELERGPAQGRETAFAS